MMDRVFAHSRAKGTDRVLLLAIARHDFNKETYPSRRRLASMCGVSLTRVKEGFARLVELGELENFTRKGKTSLYVITLKCPDECSEPGHSGWPTKENDPDTPGDRQSDRVGDRLNEGEEKGRKSVESPSAPPSDATPLESLIFWINEGVAAQQKFGLDDEWLVELKELLVADEMSLDERQLRYSTWLSNSPAGQRIIAGESAYA